MIKDDPKETGDVINASKLGHANNIASVKVGTKTYMALSDANGKIWVASTTDGKDWTIVKEELSLTGSVSSMVVKDAQLLLCEGRSAPSGDRVGNRRLG